MVAEHVGEVEIGSAVRTADERANLFLRLLLPACGSSGNNTMAAIWNGHRCLASRRVIPSNRASKQSVGIPIYQSRLGECGLLGLRPTGSRTGVTPRSLGIQTAYPRGIGPHGGPSWIPHSMGK